MEDRRIVALFWQRAEKAIAATAQKYGGLLQSIAVNILGDHHKAQECVNDTYLALWNRIPPEKPEPFSAYICRIDRNIALNRRRDDLAQKRNCEFDLSLEELSGCLAGPSLEETVDARALGRAIDAYLATISRENRILFLRRYWFGDSVPQAASLLGIQKNAASIRLYRIRNGLREYLIREGYYEE